jgi:hypothetical protein
MAIPQEHQPYLRRTGYAPPPGAAFTEEEAAVLERYGYWMEALAGGLIAPTTPEQRRFLQVARGEAAPQTQFERIWGKLAGASAPAVPRADPGPGNGRAEARVGGDEDNKFEQLAELRAYAGELRKRADAEREQVLEKVRAELQAVEAKYEPALQEASQAIAELEAEVKAEVLKVGRTVRVGPVRAVFYRGRVTWDSKGLARYAQGHPELERFRKVGAPCVVIRYK